MKLIDSRIMRLTPVSGTGASYDWCLNLVLCRTCVVWHKATKCIQRNEMPVV